MRLIKNYSIPVSVSALYQRNYAQRHCYPPLCYHFNLKA